MFVACTVPVEKRAPTVEVPEDRKSPWTERVLLGEVVPMPILLSVLIYILEVPVAVVPAAE